MPPVQAHGRPGRAASSHRPGAVYDGRHLWRRALAIMRNSHVWLLALPLLVWSDSFAQQPGFSAEEEHLTELPASLAEAIHKASPAFKSCHIVGRKVTLSATGVAYAGTTAHGCGWGPSIAPIWIVRPLSSGAQVILSTTAMNVYVLPGDKNGLRKIRTDQGTAEFYETQFWSFDGTSYQKGKEFTFSAEDTPEARERCHAHPGICPWQYDP